MTDTATQRSEKRDLTSGPLIGTLLSLAVPLAALQILGALYSLVDTFWLGRVSTEAQASPGVAWRFTFIIFMIINGFGSAGAALVAQNTGARRYREADHAAGQLLMSFVVLTVVMSIPMIVFAPELLRWNRAPENIIPMATSYMRIYLAGMPLMAFVIGYGAVLRALGDTLTVLIISVVSNAINIVLDPILILGLFGMPRMEVAGAALATVTAQAGAVVACYACLRMRRAGLHITPQDLKPHWPILQRTVAIGTPAAIGNSSNSVGMLLFGWVFNRFGATAIAAYSIGFRFIHLFSPVAFSMAMATAPVVGQALGAGKPKLARRAIRISATVVAVSLFVPTAFMILFGRLLAHWFNRDPAVVAEAARFFRIVPASTYFFGVLVVLMAAFYGSGHTRPTMVISILRNLLRFGAAYLLAIVAGWGTVGAYAGMVAGNLACAFLALLFFLAGGWQKPVIPIEREEPAELEPSGTPEGG